MCTESNEYDSAVLYYVYILYKTISKHWKLHFRSHLSDTSFFLNSELIFYIIYLYEAIADCFFYYLFTTRPIGFTYDSGDTPYSPGKRGKSEYLSRIRTTEGDNKFL